MAADVVNITCIAFILGATRYHPADKFDPERAIKSGLSSEASMEILRDQGYFAPITPETFRKAYARRAGDLDPVPAGFTMAYLYEAGYLDRPAVEPKARVKAKAAAAPKEKAKVLDYITLGENMIEHAGNRIQPTKNGRFTLFSVTDPEGRLLRAERFNKIEKAKAFLDEVAKAKETAQPSTPEAESATPAEAAEHADDDADLQPQPV